MTAGGSSVTGRALDRRILALAIPAVGALLADPLLGVVDTAVAGRVSVTALGALGLGTAILGAGTWIFNFLVFGTTSAVARAAGAGRDDLAGRRVVHATAVAVVLGVVVAAVVGLLAEPIVRASGAVDELVEPTAAYLRVRAVGLPFVLVAMVGHGAFRGVEDTRTPLVVVVIANLLNATLDIVLVVFGDGGLTGIAWATVAAEVLAVVLLGVLIGRTGLELRGHGLPTRGEVGDLLRVSRDVVLRTGGLVGGLLLVAAAAARVDTATAAAHQVLYQVFIFAAFLQDSLAVAGQALVGNAIGRGDEGFAQQLMRRLLRWGVGLGVVTAALLLSLGGVLPGLLTDDATVIAVAGSAWMIAALVQLPGGVAFVLDGVLMGAEDWAYLRTWTVVAAVGAGLAAQAVPGLGGGLPALWWCVVGMMVVRAGSLALRVRRDDWLDPMARASATAPDAIGGTGTGGTDTGGTEVVPAPADSSAAADQAAVLDATRVGDAAATTDADRDRPGQ